MREFTKRETRGDACCYNWRRFKSGAVSGTSKWEIPANRVLSSRFQEPTRKSRRRTPIACQLGDRIAMKNTLEFAARLTIVIVLTTVCSSANHAQTARKTTPRPKRSTTVGPAIGENKATPIDRIKAAKGFRVELLYSVPSQEEGSWVNLCTDHKGRLLVSDQFGGLYRLTPPPTGIPLRQQDIETVPAEIRAVNGMVCVAMQSRRKGDDVNDLIQIAVLGVMYGLNAWCRKDRLEEWGTLQYPELAPETRDTIPKVSPRSKRQTSGEKLSG